MRKITSKEFRFFTKKDKKLNNFFLLFLFLFSVSFSFAQINYQQDWNNSTTILDWSGTGWNNTALSPCEGDRSIRTNVFGTSTASTQIVTSPNLGPSNGGLITLTYDYKVVEFGALTTPTPADKFNLYWEWSTSTTGPWTQFATINATNHQPSANCVSKSHTLTVPEVYSPTLYIRHRAVNNGGDFYVYLDNLKVFQGASSICTPPTNVGSTNITKNSANISWYIPSFYSTATYSWELRTSGEAGSGALGLVQSGTVASGVNTLSLSGLLPQTQYSFYIKTHCNPTESFWSPVPHVFSTKCEYPDILSTTGATICGYGSATLLATVQAGGNLYWFENLNENFLHQGASFQTPMLSSDKTYYVKAGEIKPGMKTQVGQGQTASAVAGDNPYNHTFGGAKHQFIYTAAELSLAGITAGPINSIGFQVNQGSNVTRKNFTIHIGSTQQVAATTNFITNLQQVYSNSEQSVTAGDNIYDFTTPFIWDGTSSIVVQVCWSNQNGGQSAQSGSVYSHTASAPRTLTRQQSNQTAAEILANPTGVLTSKRPNTLFNAMVICFSPETPVQVSVSPSPELALSSTSINSCLGEDSDVVTLTAGMSDYDTFTWEPATGVTGNHVLGWKFNLQDSRTYSLVASQSNGDCSKRINFDVNVIKLGYKELEDTYSVCVNEVKKISILKENPIDNLVKNNNYVNGFENGLQTMSLSGTGGTISSVSNLQSVGEKSIKWSYVNSANSNLTIDQTFDFSDAEGLEITFDHIAMLENFDYGRVQYSLDGGQNWSNFLPNQYFGQATGTTTNVRFNRASYTQWSGLFLADNNNLWRKERLVLLKPQDNDFSNIKIRFVLSSDTVTTYEGWYLDNVIVSKLKSTKKTWQPATNLYLNQELTQPYNGESVGEVYFSANTPGQYPVTVRVSDGEDLCEVAVNTTVLVPNLVFPGLTQSVYCDSVSVDDLQFARATGATYQWYPFLSSQTPITQIPGSGTYYVKISSAHCESQKQPVQITIVGDANVTVSATQQFCEGATVADLYVDSFTPNATVQWFSSATATTPLAATEVLPVGTHTYYVNQRYYNCDSERKPVQVTVHSMPAPLNQNQITVCYNSTVGSVSLDGTNNLKWYTSLGATNPLGPNTVLTNSVYYVEKINGTCVRPRVAVQVSVLSQLSTFPESVINICGTGNVGDLAGHVSGVVEGAEVKWYSSANSTTPLANTQMLSNGVYYGEQHFGNCVSSRKAVVVRVNSLVAPVVAAQTVCANTRIQDIVLPTTTGGSYQWFATANATQPLLPTTPFTTQTYYVRRLQNGCLSNPTAVPVSVISSPNAPTGVSPQVLEEGSTLANIVMDQTGITWYITLEDAQAGTNPLMNNMPIINGTVYYAVLVSPQGCRSLPTPIAVNVTVGINDLDIASLKLYPNPTDSILNVSYKETIDRIEVYSITGQLLIAQDTYSNEESIDMSQLSSGTYMIKISAGKNSQILKVIRK